MTKHVDKLYWMREYLKIQISEVHKHAGQLEIYLHPWSLEPCFIFISVLIISSIIVICSTQRNLILKKMASSVAANSIVTISAVLSPKGPLLRSSHVVGLPMMSKLGKVKCSMEEKKVATTAVVEESNLGMNASLIAAACAAAATVSSSPAMALVDERMSTEGTGLPFGLSNNLLGWILLGVFGLIWALYTIYAGSLDEDEESGLSL